MKFHLAVFIALSSLLLLNVSNISSYETREILPSTGYWNYLPVFGIWARIVHFLAVDSDGLGQQVKDLDRYFKSRHSNYVAIVNEVVTKFPKMMAAFRALKIKDNLLTVQDPITKQTLGDAFDIIHEIGTDDRAVDEIATRLNLVNPDNISMVSSSRSEFDLKTTLVNTIIGNPMIIGDVLKDPQVVNFITGTILQYLGSDQVVHGIESLQELISILQMTHPNMFLEGQNPISDLRDAKTGMTFIKALQTLVNIIESPKFAEELAKLLNQETLTYLHEKTQGVVTKVIAEKVKRDSAQKSKPSEQSDESILQNAENQGPTMTAKDLVEFLKMLQITLDEKIAEKLLQLAKDNELGDKAKELLNELSQIDDLTPEKVAQFIREKGVEIGEKSVKEAINTITSLSADTLSGTLQAMGLNMPQTQVAEMKNTIEKLKKNYERNHSSSNHVSQPNPNSASEQDSKQLTENDNSGTELKSEMI